MFLFRKTVHYLWPHMKKFSWAFYSVFVLFALRALADSVIRPYVFKEIIDVISGSYQSHILASDKLNTLLIYFIVMSIAVFIISRGSKFILIFFESKVIKELYDFCFVRIVNQSPDFFANTFSGSLVTKTKRFVRSFETLFDITVFNMWMFTITLIGIFITIFNQSILLGSILLIWIVIYVSIILLFIKKKVKYDLLESAADSTIGGRLADTFSNIFTVKSFSAHKYEMNNFMTVTKDEEKKRTTAWFFGGKIDTIQAIMNLIIQCVLVYTMIHLWLLDKITTGTVVLTQTYIIIIMDKMWDLGNALTRFTKSMMDMKEVMDIFEHVPNVLDPINPEISRMQKGAISFNSVRFEYQGEVEVFNDFNFNIASGERIGLVGKSGSGKTTITKLILRFMDIHGGEITIDGQDIRKVTQDDLRKAVSYVPQEPILFHRTIRENIAYGKTDATLEEVIEAAKKAHAHEFISSFAHGYDTFVGERGVKLSGGERQRVAIARAILKNAPILILDEATSALDSVSESYIQIALEELMKGKTVIVIAHRLSTIQKMDRIIVLDHGEIKEEGTHKELLEKNGIYRELWDHQSGGFLSE